MPNIKTSGTMIYVQEELSDARLRCDELKRQLSKALDLVNSSSYVDHIHAIAGDLLHSIPTTITKLEKALEAVAMSINRLDYEEIRMHLRPEKVEQLDKVLDEVRLVIPKRFGDLPVTSPDNYEAE